MDVDYRANFGQRGPGSVEMVIDRQEAFAGQFVRPLDQDGLAGVRLNGRPRKRVSETPLPTISSSMMSWTRSQSGPHVHR
jgi:hypothetical protein